MSNALHRWSERRRLSGTMGAQLFNQFVTLVTQLLLVPVLLAAWGIDRYAAWLLLSVVPTYLTLTDLGFTSVAKNEMTMNEARGDRPAVLRTYHSVLALLLVIALPALGAVTAFATFVRLTALWPLGGISEADAAAVFILLSLVVLLFQFMLLGMAGLRCLGQPAEEVLWGACARVADAVLVAGAALAGTGLVAAAAAMLVGRIILTVMLFLRLRRLAPWLTLGCRQGARDEMRRLLAPALSHMSYVAGSAAMVQGPVLALGSSGTARDIVVFSATRTLARLGVAAANVLTFSLAPEYARLFGAAHYARVATLLLKSLGVMAAFAGIYLVMMLWLGDLVLSVWTGGAVAAEYPFFVLMLCAVALEMLWGTGFAPQAATNQHVLAANGFLMLSLVAVGVCFFLPGPSPLTGTGMVLVALNLAMVAVIIATCLRERYFHGVALGRRDKDSPCAP